MNSALLGEKGEKGINMDQGTRSMFSWSFIRIKFQHRKLYLSSKEHRDSIMEVLVGNVANMLPFVVTTCHLSPFFANFFFTSDDWFYCLSCVSLFVVLWHQCNLWDWLAPVQSSSSFWLCKWFFLECMCIFEDAFW